MRLTTQAGEFEANAYTDGHPIRTSIKLNRSWGLGNVEFTHVELEGLYDLKHCVERMIAQIETDERQRERRK